jgi:membrane protein YdbS with pleckstrin-like domain
MKTEGMGWRVGVSIVAFFGSIIAVILWLFFYAGSFNVYQNIAIVVVILLAFIAVIGATWASWGMRRRDWRERGRHP